MASVTRERIACERFREMYPTSPKERFEKSIHIPPCVRMQVMECLFSYGICKMICKTIESSGSIIVSLVYKRMGNSPAVEILCFVMLFTIKVPRKIIWVYYIFIFKIRSVIDWRDMLSVPTPHNNVESIRISTFPISFQWWFLEPVSHLWCFLPKC